MQCSPGVSLSSPKVTEMWPWRSSIVGESMAWSHLRLCHRTQSCSAGTEPLWGDWMHLGTSFLADMQMWQTQFTPDPAGPWDIGLDKIHTCLRTYTSQVVVSLGTNQAYRSDTQGKWAVTMSWEAAAIYGNLWLSLLLEPFSVEFKVATHLLCNKMNVKYMDSSMN